MANRNIVIVGATGFIGSSLIDELVKSDENRVFAIGRKKNSFIESIEGKFKNFQFLELDLTNLSDDSKIPSKIDILYYLVSGTHPAKSWDRPEIELELNLLPLINFMRLLTSSSTKLSKLLFLSSGGTIYGEAKMGANGFEEESLNKPLVPYGIFKKTQEDLLRYYSKKLDFILYNFRVGNVYGPNYSKQKDFGVINIWLSQIIEGKPIKVFGSNEIIRDYIFIKDLTAMLIYPLDKNLAAGEYNISTGSHCSLKELLEIIVQISPITVNVEQLPGRASDADVVVLNGDKFNTLYNASTTTIHSGIKETITFLRNESK